MNTKEKLAAFLGVDVKEFSPEEISKDERISELEAALAAMLEGRTE